MLGEAAARAPSHPGGVSAPVSITAAAQPSPASPAPGSAQLTATTRHAVGKLIKRKLGPAQGGGTPTR